MMGVGPPQTLRGGVMMDYLLRIVVVEIVLILALAVALPLWGLAWWWDVSVSFWSCLGVGVVGVVGWMAWWWGQSRTGGGPYEYW